MPDSFKYRAVRNRIFFKYVCGGTTTLGGTFSPLTIGGYADPNYKYYNTCAGVAVYGGAHQALTIGGNVTINQVRDHSIKVCLRVYYSLSPAPIRATYRDEARHGKAFEGLLARYFG